MKKFKVVCVSSDRGGREKNESVIEIDNEKIDLFLSKLDFSNLSKNGVWNLIDENKKLIGVEEFDFLYDVIYNSEMDSSYDENEDFLIFDNKKLIGINWSEFDKYELVSVYCEYENFYSLVNVDIEKMKMLRFIEKVKKIDDEKKIEEMVDSFLENLLEEKFI